MEKILKKSQRVEQRVNFDGEAETKVHERLTISRLKKYKISGNLSQKIPKNGDLNT